MIDAIIRYGLWAAGILAAVVILLEAAYRWRSRAGQPEPVEHVRESDR